MRRSGEIFKIFKSSKTPGAASIAWFWLSVRKFKFPADFFILSDPAAIISYGQSNFFIE